MEAMRRLPFEVPISPKKLYEWYMRVLKTIPPITLKYRAVPRFWSERVLVGYRKTGRKRTVMIDSVTGDEIGPYTGIVGRIVEFEYEEEEPIYETRVHRYDSNIITNKDEVEQWYRSLTFEQKLALNCAFYYGTEEPSDNNELMSMMQVVGGVEQSTYNITDDEVFIDSPIELAEIYCEQMMDGSWRLGGAGGG